MALKTIRPYLMYSVNPDPAGNGGGAGGDGDSGQTPSGQQSQNEGGSGDRGNQDNADNGGENGEDPEGRGSKQAVLQDLARERDKRQELEARLKELTDAEEERKRAEMSELEKAQADLEKERTEREAAQSELNKQNQERLRTSIASEMKLPAAMAGRISGGTEEEMRADAKALAEALGPYTGPPDNSQGSGGAKTAPAATLTDALNAHYQTNKN